MNKVNTVPVRKPATFGNKAPRQWDGRRRVSKFDTFQGIKVQFDTAVRECRWESVLVLGQEIEALDVRDFNQGELEFYNLALPRIKFYLDTKRG